MTSFSILTVCTGNICRSPLAERVLRSQLGGVHPGTVVESAGTHAMVGAPMQETAAAELARLGGAADDFRARQLAVRMIADADLVLTMTREQRTYVLEEHPRALRRTFTLREFALLLQLVGPAETPRDLADVVAAAAESRSRLAEVPASMLDIADPYGLPAEHYRVMADDVAVAVATITAAVARLTGR